MFMILEPHFSPHTLPTRLLTFGLPTSNFFQAAKVNRLRKFLLLLPR